MSPAVIPPLNCNFRVVFENPDFCNDIGFYSIQGISARLNSDTPSGKRISQFENLKLIRAYVPDSKLIEWCMDAINNQNFRAEEFRISLIGEKENVLSSWIIKKAVPVAWGIEDLHAQETRILLETIELSYAYFEVVNSSGKIIAPKAK